jgi:AcrR family transcriptional regulator
MMAMETNVHAGGAAATVSHPPAAARSDSDAPRAPGRPRSIRVDEAIIDAVLDLLAEGNIETMSIEAIAARAGVGKAALYRRWANKDDLLLDAIRTLKGTPPRPAGQSVRDDLVMLLSLVGRAPDPRAGKIMPCLIPLVQRSPKMFRLYQEAVEPRREVIRTVLRRGIESGELRADIDIELTVAMLTGPVLMQKLLRWHPNLDERDLAARVVDALLAGLSA